MNNEKSPDARIVEKIKSVNNILVTVGSNPSIDGLAAALGLALALDKFGKHTTTVFSGQIPPAINFLSPDKVFVDNADALRDFIISLSKDKADRLRFKPEGDVVKIYITPYKTKIDAGDLAFSDGDFNVQLILAIDVEGRDELDRAIAAQGRVFHDATTAVLSVAGKKSTLGEINWTDDTSNSYAEVVEKLINRLTTDKNFIDEQMATALLTGIVSATDQFRNSKTTPGTMSVSANLMAHGANQQLITSQLSSGETLNQNAHREATPRSLPHLEITHDAPKYASGVRDHVDPVVIAAAPAPITQSDVVAERDKFAEQDAAAARNDVAHELAQIAPEQNPPASDDLSAPENYATPENAQDFAAAADSAMQNSNPNFNSDPQAAQNDAPSAPDFSQNNNPMFAQNGDPTFAQDQNFAGAAPENAQNLAEPTENVPENPENPGLPPLPTPPILSDAPAENPAPTELPTANYAERESYLDSAPAPMSSTMSSDTNFAPDASAATPNYGATIQPAPEFNFPMPPPLPPMPNLSENEAQNAPTLADDPRLAELNSAAASFANPTSNQAAALENAQQNFATQPQNLNELPPLPPLGYEPAPAPNPPEPELSPEPQPAADPTQFQIPGM